MPECREKQLRYFSLSTVAIPYNVSSVASDRTARRFQCVNGGNRDTVALPELQHVGQAVVEVPAGLNAAIGGAGGVFMMRDECHSDSASTNSTSQDESVCLKVVRGLSLATLNACSSDLASTKVS